MLTRGGNENIGLYSGGTTEEQLFTNFLCESNSLNFDI